jgi:hypothetical protein
VNNKKVTNAEVKEINFIYRWIISW